MRESGEEAKPQGRARLKQALRSLRLMAHGPWEGETALRAALDGIGLGIWEVDFARGERRWSPAQFRIFGCAPTPDGSIAESTWRDRLHPEDAAWVQAAYARSQAEHRLFEAEYRVLREDTGEQRWVSTYGHFQRRGEEDPGRITGVTIDVTERRRTEAALREADLRMRLAMEGVGLGTCDVDLRNGRGTCSRSMFELLGLEPTPDATFDFLRAWHHLVHPEDLPRLLAEQREAAGSQSAYTPEYRIVHAATGEVRWIKVFGQYLGSEAGRPADRFVGIVSDVTASKGAEARQQLLVREYNHRIRNLLALVRSLAEQTWRLSASPQNFHQSLLERLQALADAHGLLTREAWQGASLRTLAERVLAPYLAGSPGAPRVAIDGPELRVPPLTAISLSMALHELATNAVKYGALSSPHGRVSVQWAIEEGASPVRARLEWSERGGPLVEPPARRGFGSRLIERGLAVELGGEVRLEFRPEGVSCSLSFALEGEPGPY